MMTRTPCRVKCTNPALLSYGLFGTIVGSERGEIIPTGDDIPAGDIPAGVLFDVEWIDFPHDGIDEIDGSNLTRVTESAYGIELIERALDESPWELRTERTPEITVERLRALARRVADSADGGGPRYHARACKRLEEVCQAYARTLPEATPQTWIAIQEQALNGWPIQLPTGGTA